MFKEEKKTSLLNGILDENNNNKKIQSHKLNSNFSTNNNNREQFSRDYDDYDYNSERIETYYNTNSNLKQNTPAHSVGSYNSSIKNSSPQTKKLHNNNNNNNLSINQEERLSNSNNHNLINNSSNNSFRKPFDLNHNSFEEKESLATASDSVSLSSVQENIAETNSQNKTLKSNLITNTNQGPAVKNAKVVLKIADKKVNKPEIKEKEVEREKPKEKEKPPMKSRNNQSTFAKNPSQSYAEPYYASFPPNARPPKLPFSYYDYNTQFSPREVMYPYVIPTSFGPLAPFIPAAYPFHSPSGALQYNMWMRPLILDEKNPSLHDLLYYENFQRNKDVPYATKHLEKKIRAVDGFYNPYGRYTMQDYRNLKANEAFAINPNELDQETKDEKAEKMHKRQEVGNLFMKSNPKPARKPNNFSEPIETQPMLQSQRKQVNLQEPFDLNKTTRNRQQQQQENEQQFTPRNNNLTQSLDFNDQFFDLNNMQNYHPSFFNQSMNNFPSNDNRRINQSEWDSPDEKEEAKLAQSQKNNLVNHPTKKFYKNPKFNFNEKPVEVPVVEARNRAIEYAKRIKD